MALCVIGFGLIASGAFLYLNPQIPSVEEFRDIRLQTPLRIFTEEGDLLAEFGERRRIPLPLEEMPALFIQAVLDTEDKRFYDHQGVDPIGLMRAVIGLIRNQGKFTSGGGSTITMQVARNISLSLDRTFIRKFKEILLAMRIEREFEKDEILEIYLNMTPFGKRAYGAQAAALTYYGKPLSDLSLAQFAMLAGIPQAPSKGNPINGPERAMKRRNLVLGRMLEERSISQSAHDHAATEPLTARQQEQQITAFAPYAAEIIRQKAFALYGSEVYEDGYEVHTTLRTKLQRQAEEAVRAGIRAYDRRHGYRGPEQQVVLLASDDANAALQAKVAQLPPAEGHQIAIVTALDNRTCTALTEDGEQISIPWSGILWARRYIDANTIGNPLRRASDAVSVGDIIRVERGSRGWRLSQIPTVQAALVSMRPDDGAVVALVGGYDFQHSQFNHATQGGRQPGSSFKPFIYAAALHSGITLTHAYNDAPLVFEDKDLEDLYRPRNSEGTFQGLTLVRRAFYRSINLVSMRMLLDVGIMNVIDYLGSLGFATDNFPDNLQLAIGGGSISLTPMDLTTAYATLANGGYRVQPYFIRRISHIYDGPVYEAAPAVVCHDECGASSDAGEVPGADNPAEQVMDPRVNFLVHSMMQDVITSGTGSKAKVLERADLAGKTGTTNAADTWFAGFNGEVVTGVWLGFSNNEPVGDNEYGSTTALPIWIDYMRTALAGIPETHRIPPDGLVRMRIDPSTGEPTDPDAGRAFFEWFREEYAPATTSLAAESEADTTVNPTDIF